MLLAKVFILFYEIPGRNRQKKVLQNCGNVALTNKIDIFLLKKIILIMEISKAQISII